MADLMIWLLDDRGTIADAVGMSFRPGVRLDYCWQVNDTGAAMPLVLWADDQGWAAMPAPDFFTPFDPMDINCSAG